MKKPKHLNVNIVPSAKRRGMDSINQNHDNYYYGYYNLKGYNRQMQYRQSSGQPVRTLVNSVYCCTIMRFQLCTLSGQIGNGVALCSRGTRLASWLPDTSAVGLRKKRTGGSALSKVWVTASQLDLPSLTLYC